MITMWSLSVDSARDRLLSISVWACLTDISSVLQPLSRLSWLAGLIGNIKCFDANIVARKKLIYAKALIAITPISLCLLGLRFKLQMGEMFLLM